MSDSIVPPASNPLVRAIEETLRFQFVHGGRTTYNPPYVRRWRMLPHTMISHNTGGRFEIEFRDGHTERAVPDGAIVVEGGREHRVRTLGNDPVTDHWIIGNFTILGGLDLFTFVRLPTCLPASTGRVIGDLSQRLVRLPERDRSLQDATRRLKAGHDLLAVLMTHATLVVDTDRGLNDLDRILPILRYVEDHKSDPLTRRDLAALVSLSEVRLHALFKAVMDVSPMAYVKRVRLREAQTRLVNTSQSVSEIGRTVGYRDQFHFSRQFKAEFGVSPLQYRKQTGRIG